jgi:PBP1b-binding outer membrane lipoprotein LpoB
MFKKLAILLFVTVTLVSCSNNGTQNEVEDKESEGTEFFSPLKLF